MGMDWSVREGYAWAEVSSWQPYNLIADFFCFLVVGYILIFLAYTMGIFAYRRIRNTVKSTDACFKQTPQRSANEPKKEVFLS
jgi:hypothetical protein